MASIKNELALVLSNYEAEKRNFTRVNSKVPTHIILTQTLPKIFVDKASLPNSYLVKGSVGQLNFNFASVPWICFFDREITTSAQKGYYVCLLFREDMKGFYLSLNQGWTQYENEFGVNPGRLEIELNSIKARSLLRSIKDFHGDLLDLKASTPLSQGYERGNIYSRYYSADSLPDDKLLLEDLQQLLGAYRELKGLVGDNILNIRSLGSDEDFQEESQIAKKLELPTGPIKKSEQKSRNTSVSWPRNPRIAKAALHSVNYSCEYDSSHQTFISSSTGNQYVEVHHLVPMEKQADFVDSLDVPENIVALCPNCHRKIHLASKSEKDPMLEMLFNQRTHMLSTRGIHITLDDLRAIYKQLD